VYQFNQTEPAHFQFCRVGLSLGIFIFSIFYTVDIAVIENYFTSGLRLPDYASIFTAEMKVIYLFSIVIHFTSVNFSDSLSVSLSKNRK
jgi:hypothetical protein